MAVFANLPEVPALGFRQRSHNPIVDHQHINAAPPPEQIAENSVGATSARSRNSAASIHRGMLSRGQCVRIV